MAKIIDTTAVLRGEDLTGKKFGRLTVVSFAGTSNRVKKHWNCVCECTRRTIVFGSHLKDGRIASCGCLRDEVTSLRSTTHGLSGTALHRIWKGMKQRCSDPKCVNFERYGGRGIRVLEPWLSSFLSFHADMAPSYFSGLSIERNDNSGPYCKENCRWATDIEQGRNKRNNVMVFFNGENRPVSDWAERLNLDSRLIYLRISRGWSGERAISTPCPKSAVNLPGVALGK